METGIIEMVAMAAGALGGMGALFSVGLAIANKKLYVEEDPRVTELVEVLPSANCGGCGLPGCGAFAEALVTGDVDVNGCPVADSDMVEEMAAILGVDASSGEKMYARIMCQGGYAEKAVKGTYIGGTTCSSAHLGGGGDFLCTSACLGYGDCVKACPFDAMYMSENGLPVVIEEKCTGCGNCVEPCPRDLVEMHPESNRLFVLCKNTDEAKHARSVCTRACTACNLCVKGAGDGDMSLENNLAIVNYEQYGKGDELPTQKCQTGSIVVLAKDGVYYPTQEEIDRANGKEPAKEEAATEA